MDWIETKLYTTTEGVEAVTAVLMEAGVRGIQVQDDLEMRRFLETTKGQWDYVDDALLAESSEEVYVVFYVSDNVAGREQLMSVRNGVERLSQLSLPTPMGRLTLESHCKNDESWLNHWKKYYKPFQVGKRLVIKPIWEEYSSDDGRKVLQLNPGHVFGTGLHQTTQLCLEQLENYIEPQSRVLDLGCGSGVLSIGAILLGAQEARAVDIDPNAVDIAYENASLNGIARGVYRVYAGDILENQDLKKQVAESPFDVIVTNIVADTVIQFADFVAQMLKEGGVWIASGIIRERLADVEAAILDHHFQWIGAYWKDDWVCVVSRIGIR